MSLVCVDDFEQHAKRFLPKMYWQYYSGGTDANISLQESKNAFKSTVAPTGVHKFAHPDGEVATAKAANRAGTCMILSSWASSTIEEVAQSSPEGLRWFQLHISKSEKETISRIRRAEKENYKALALTIDTPYYGRGHVTNHPLKFPPHIKYANVLWYMDVLKKNSKVTEECHGKQAELNWGSFISWLRIVTKLPIILKGVSTAEDARLAVQHEVDGIIVSNHGGRQLDTVAATIEVLPEIVAAVDNKCEVYLDGGIRHGTDVFKALALGARAVFVGRPVLWGLVYKGEEGAYQVLQILKEEFKLAMGLMGCTSLKDISREMVLHQSFYSRI